MVGVKIDNTKGLNKEEVNATIKEGVKNTINNISDWLKTHSIETGAIEIKVDD